jgi:hypothetical protein
MTGFLGKSFPSERRPEAGPSRLDQMTRVLGVGYLMALLLGGSTFAMTRLDTPAPKSVVPPPTEVVSFADFAGTTTLASATAPIAGTSSASTYCDIVANPSNASDPSSRLHVAFEPTNIFPILPSAILTGVDNSGNATNCTPPYWNFDIIRVLMYKVLALLNYGIEVAAIIFTLYAGILYLTGFRAEKNIETAKKLLIATYTGMIISLSATLLLRSAVSAFADPNSAQYIQSNQNCILNANASC